MLKRLALRALVGFISRMLAGEMSQAKAAGFVRHGLTTLGGILVAKGIVDASLVEPLVGAGMTAFGIFWSLVVKR